MKNLLLAVTLTLFALPSLSQETKNSAKAGTQSRLNYALDKSNPALGISADVLTMVSGIEKPPLNIALFGVDRRNDQVYGNADMIMILSLDQVTNKIKLSSILRDTYVSINGHGMDKINAAYATGGPQLAIRTLNENFSMDIRDFLSIDFFGSAKIIDALGGVTLNLKNEEVPYMNNYLKEIGPELMSTDRIKNYGVQKLNGRQTVAYTRIRSVGNNDYERTARQRKVMTALLDKFRLTEKQAFNTLVMEVMPYVETSMSGMALFTLGSEILNIKNISVEPAMFPLAKESKSLMINGIWYLSTDLKASTSSLHNFIYKNQKPVN